MPLPDWNHNGKSDAFDHYIDMKIINVANSPKSSSANKSNNKESKGISMGGKPTYDTTKGSNGVVILKSLLVVVLCLGGIVLPVILEMGAVGTLICIFGGLAASIAILKNV